MFALYAVGCFLVRANEQSVFDAASLLPRRRIKDGGVLLGSEAKGKTRQPVPS